MFHKGEVIIHNGIEMIVLNIDYKTRRLQIGIPDSDNITRQKSWVAWELVKKQS